MNLKSLRIDLSMDEQRKDTYEEISNDSSSEEEKNEKYNPRLIECKTMPKENITCSFMVNSNKHSQIFVTGDNTLCHVHRQSDKPTCSIRLFLLLL